MFAFTTRSRSFPKRWGVLQGISPSISSRSLLPPSFCPPHVFHRRRVMGRKGLRVSRGLSSSSSVLCLRTDPRTFEVVWGTRPLIPAFLFIQNSHNEFTYSQMAEIDGWSTFPSTFSVTDPTLVSPVAQSIELEDLCPPNFPPHEDPSRGVLPPP